jgi:beta-lactam-binding protein with PASTA domain
MKARALISQRNQREIYGADLGIGFSPKIFVAAIVPDLIGMTLEQAQTALSALGLTHETHGDVSTNVQAQSPPSGAEVAPGSLVTIVFNVVVAFSSGFSKGFR